LFPTISTSTSTYHRIPSFQEFDIDESTMERGHTSKVRYWANKLAVKQIEPNLSTAQLMLVNEDLKPGTSSI
jgi:hypothetical protein